MKFRVVSESKSESSRHVEGDGANQKVTVQKVGVHGIVGDKLEPSLAGELTLLLPPEHPPLVHGKVYELVIAEAAD